MIDASLESGMVGRWFGEFAVGDAVETGGVTLTESQILDFALTYDPQRFQIDAEAAATGPFGGLIASGFPTLGLSFRLAQASTARAWAAVRWTRCAGSGRCGPAIPCAPASRWWRCARRAG